MILLSSVKIKMTLISVGWICLSFLRIVYELIFYLLLLEKRLRELISFGWIRRWCSLGLFFFELIVHIELNTVTSAMLCGLILATFSNHVWVLAPSFVRPNVVLSIIVEWLCHPSTSHLYVLLRPLRACTLLPLVRLLRIVSLVQGLPQVVSAGPILF